MAIVNVGLHSPWIDFYKKVDKFFEGDEGVEVLFDESNFTLSLFVEDETKAAALSQLLPSTKEFGNITVTIQVFVGNHIANATSETNLGKLFEDALTGNTNFKFVLITSEFITNPIIYVVFECEVVQYYTDDLSDAYGNRNTLWQTLAAEIFVTPSPVYYSTGVQNAEYDD